MLDLFTKSIIKKISLQKINAQKLDPPTKGSPLNVGIGVGLNFNDEKTDLGYEVTFKLTISCKEGGEEKLCKLEYVTKVTYEIEGEPKEIGKKFNKDNFFFIRELYHLIIDDLNDILYKMKVRIQLPLSLTEDFILNLEEVDEEQFNKLS